MLLLVLLDFSLLMLYTLFSSNGSGSVNALRDVRVKMPHAIRRGEKAILKCYYDMEGDSLYSVKWYIGRREFYRYTPKENPAMKTFPIQGAIVDRRLIINVIMEIRPRYRVGDSVRGRCTSRHYKPAANLTWTVNNHETNPAHIRHHRPLHDPRNDMETATSSIQFHVIEQHFVNGKLKIRCSAYIHDVYWQSTEKSIEEYKHFADLNGNGNSVNLVQRLPYDQFSLQATDINKYTDTYLTHVQGDVSSLNSGDSSRESCILRNASTTIFLLFFLIVSNLFSWLHLNNYSMNNHHYRHQHHHEHLHNQQHEQQHPTRIRTALHVVQHLMESGS